HARHVAHTGDLAVVVEVDQARHEQVAADDLLRTETFPHEDALRAEDAREVEALARTNVRDLVEVDEARRERPDEPELVGRNAIGLLREDALGGGPPGEEWLVERCRVVERVVEPTLEL